jgi:hypothetical protein
MAGQRTSECLRRSRNRAQTTCRVAILHPHDLLVTVYYSVHTNRNALDRGETEIRRIGAGLLASRRLRQPIRL